MGGTLANLMNQGGDSIKLTSMKDSPMCLHTAKFCYDSDFIARMFGNYIYAIDGSAGMLHVYSVKDK